MANKGGGIAVLGFGAVGAIGGLVLLLVGFSQRGEADVIAQAAPTTVAQLQGGQAPGGAVKLGAVIGSDSPAVMPGTGEPVVYGKLKITGVRTEYRRGKRRTKRRSLFSETVRASSAYLSDGDARVAIDPAALRAADITAPSRRKRPTSRKAGGLLSSGTVRYGNVSVSNRSSGRGKTQIDKTALLVGARVFVVGAARGVSGAPGLGAGEHGLHIYTKSEAQVVASLRSSAGWMIPVGGAVIGIGAIGLLVGAFIFFSASQKG